MIVTPELSVRIIISTGALDQLRRSAHLCFVPVYVGADPIPFYPGFSFLGVLAEKSVRLFHLHAISTLG